MTVEQLVELLEEFPGYYRVCLDPDTLDYGDEGLVVPALQEVANVSVVGELDVCVVIRP